jgi:hypothetical protein
VQYSPAHSRAASVGAYYLIRDSVVTLGSFIGAALWGLGAQVNFLTAAGIGVLASAFYISTLRRDRTLAT